MRCPNKAGDLLVVEYRETKNSVWKIIPFLSNDYYPCAMLSGPEYESIAKQVVECIIKNQGFEARIVHYYPEYEVS